MPTSTVTDLGPGARFLEDFTVGESTPTSARTVTETDIVNFTGLSGDFNELHVDVEYARALGYEDRLAHGLLVVAIVSGLVSQLGVLRGTAVGFLESTTRYLSPVVAGDTIRALVIIEELRPTKRPERGVLKRRIEVRNQRNDLVQESLHTLLVRRRGAGDDPGELAAAPGETR